MINKNWLLVWVAMLFYGCLMAQDSNKDVEVFPDTVANSNVVKVLYGTASYYADKFHGQKTATGEIFYQNKFTAACNVLPLNSWIRVTNLKNGKFVVLRTNDRLHPKTRRIVDLTTLAAKKLGYISAGLTRVKVELLKK